MRLHDVGPVCCVKYRMRNFEGNPGDKTMSPITAAKPDFHKKKLDIVQLFNLIEDLRKRLNNILIFQLAHSPPDLALDKIAVLVIHPLHLIPYLMSICELVRGRL